MALDPLALETQTALEVPVIHATWAASTPVCESPKDINVVWWVSGFTCPACAARIAECLAPFLKLGVDHSV